MEHAERMICFYQSASKVCSVGAVLLWGLVILLFIVFRIPAAMRFFMRQRAVRYKNRSGGWKKR